MTQFHVIHHFEALKIPSQIMELLLQSSAQLIYVRVVFFQLQIAEPWAIIL